MIAPEQYSHINRLLQAQLATFPEHYKYLVNRFSGTTEVEFIFLEELAAMIQKIVGSSVEEYAADYRWLTANLHQEEIEFRRTGRYRLSTFAEADRNVYANQPYMTRYMNGVLMSQLWWRNHSDVMHYFQREFLPGNKPDFRHLEIGPGHGLYLYYAAIDERCGSATGWDVSSTSINIVRKTIDLIGIPRPVSLELVNLMNARGHGFDSVTFSEVLEHLEEPLLALHAIRNVLGPDGRAFINVPVNSPAPDHITLFKTPEEVVELVSSAGFEIEKTLFLPMSGSSLERARKLDLTISTVVIARKRTFGS